MPEATALPYLAFGKELRRIRKQRLLTQVELAMAVGVATSYISHLEIGKYRPAPEVLRRLCRALDADYGSLATLLRYMPDEEDDVDVLEFRRFPRSWRRRIIDFLLTFDLGRDEAEMREEERHRDGEEDNEAGRPETG